MPECASIAVVTTFLYCITHAQDKTMFILPTVPRPRYSAWMFIGAGLFVLLVGLIVAVLFATGAIPPYSGPGARHLNESLAALRSGFRTERFKIELRYVKPVTSEVAEAFEYAKNRWERVLLNNIDNVVRLKKDQKLCGQVLTEAITIENLLIFVKVDEIDGVGNVLATAGPCGLDSERRARAGMMNFDSADIVRLQESGRIRTVVLHEMVLGLGTLWEVRRLVSSKTSSSKQQQPSSSSWYSGDVPVQAAVRQMTLSLSRTQRQSPEEPIEYLGKEGNAGHQEIGGKGRAIVETVGGSGTAGTHWKESVYGNELMTGFINTSGGKAPISLLSVRALSDLGYAVDPSGADEFTIPDADDEAASAAGAGQAEASRGDSHKGRRHLRRNLAYLRSSDESEAIDLRNDAEIKIPIVGLSDSFPKRVRSDWVP